MTDHHLYDRGAVLRTINVGPNLDVLVFAEPLAPANLGFRHQCVSWEDDQEPDGVCTKVPAPRLTNHTVTGPEDALTIRASIACPDCHLHGFVTDGVWSSC